jgi:hypothetical protein
LIVDDVSNDGHFILAGFVARGEGGEGDDSNKLAYKNLHVLGEKRSLLTAGRRII